MTYRLRKDPREVPHPDLSPKLGARLRIHPQTVRYRMRRLEELFGPGLREPTERFELELVLRARRILGPLEVESTE